MKTAKKKIRRMILKTKARFAPLLLLCYPASVVLMFFLVGMLTRDEKKDERKSLSDGKKVRAEKIIVNKQ